MKDLFSVNSSGSSCKNVAVTQDDVLRPALFLIFINDYSDAISSQLSVDQNVMVKLAIHLKCDRQSVINSVTK